MKHIYRIEYAAVEGVRPQWVDLPAQTCRLPDNVFWREIPTAGLVALSHTQEWELGMRRSTVKVSALLQNCLCPLPLVRCAFRLTDGDGRQFLLGYYGAALPLALLSDIRPDSPSERAARTLNLTAEIPLLQIL